MKREFTRLPSPQHTSEFVELSKLIDEHASTLKAFRKGRAHYEALQLERQRARNEDGKARVEAYRSGKADPGAKREAKVLRRMEELEDKQSVIERAYVEVEREISLLVSQKRAEWVPKVQDLIRGDDQELAVLLEQVGAVMKRRQAHSGLHEWLEELPTAYTPKPFVADGFNENVAVNFLISTIGKTTKNDDDEVEAIGA
jgi:hypothetical protein